MIELRLYPSIDETESIKVMDFPCLTKAWEYAEFMVRDNPELALRDFFTLETK